MNMVILNYPWLTPSRFVGLVTQAGSLFAILILDQKIFVARNKDPDKVVCTESSTIYKNIRCDGRVV